MTFDQLLTAVRSENELIIPADWTQGRASFGGLTASLVFARMQSLVAKGRPVRSMQVSFVGPVEADVPAIFEAEILREGRAVSQVMGRIIQKGETRLVCLASGYVGAPKRASSCQFLKLDAGHYASTP